tara:strand:- start:142 stop:2127 length:1986 start_codon:yes stop_codon:yes gene_type:complete
MEIIYNCKLRFQRRVVKDSIKTLAKILQLPEFYEDIESTGQFFNTNYTSKEISDLIKGIASSDTKILVQHYFPPWYKKPKYKTTNAFVSPFYPNKINLLGHRLNRKKESMVGTITHEFVHCVDGLEEIPNRAIFGFTHSGQSNTSQNAFAAPNQIGRIGSSYSNDFTKHTTPENNTDPDQIDNAESNSNLSKLEYISVGKKGRYATKGKYRYSKKDLNSLVTHLRDTKCKKLAIYFHGGLVNESEGAEAVRRVIDNISPTENTNDFHAIGFIWKTGLKETIVENLSDVFSSGLGYMLLRILTKIIGQHVDKGNDDFSYHQVDNYFYGREVYPSLDSDQKAIFSGFENDPDKLLRSLEKKVEEELAVLDLDENNLLHWQNIPKETVTVSSDLYQAIENDLNDKEQKGALGLRRVILIAKVLFKVVTRLRNGTHHGVHATIVEEIFQKFFVANIGRKVWGSMKKKAESMWELGNPGGDLLSALSEIEGLQLELIGHSAGANCIGELISKISSKNSQININNCILMAPATNYLEFKNTYIKHRNKYRKLTMFAMDDKRERNDVLLDDYPILKYIYPSSLLYFISGVLENSSSEFPNKSDQPITGMTRYINRNSTYNNNHYQDFRDFISAAPENEIIVTNDIVDHGDFDNDEEVILPKIKKLIHS